MVPRVEVAFTSCNGDGKKKKKQKIKETLRDMFISGHVTLLNVLYPHICKTVVAVLTERHQRDLVSASCSHE